MNIYKVTSGVESENFSKAVIDAMKRLGLIESIGSTVVKDNVRVFHYRPKVKARGNW